MFQRLMTASAVFLLGAVLLGAQAPSTPPPAPPDVKSPPADTTKTGSGLAFRVLQAGTGQQRPGIDDFVTIHYTGWSSDGRLIDSSYTAGVPSTFPVKGMVKGWIEGVTEMVEGERRRLWIPEQLAYEGQRGRPRGTVVFDVELVAIASSPMEAPADVAGPPVDALRTPSGLAYKVLRAGTGTSRPGPRSQVTVHYSGWTTDGTLFDSSWQRGAPADFTLSNLIPGWTEGIQLMVVGDRTRFWIPEPLAYDGAAGSPQGMLVFDVELVSFR